MRCPEVPEGTRVGRGVPAEPYSPRLTRDGSPYLKPPRIRSSSVVAGGADPGPKQSLEDMKPRGQRPRLQRPGLQRARGFVSIVWVLVALTFAVSSPLSAVYAPIPLVEQGKALTLYLGSGIYYDSNIFGAETGRLHSLVYQLLPSVAFNASVQKQTFASLNYHLSLDYFADRPGKKLLDSHELVARVAHTVSPETEIDISDSYQISKNPASLLPGVGTLVNTDQSYRLNQIDGRFSTTLTRRNGLLFKTRVTSYSYVNDVLARDLDRDELLFGASAVHTLLPTLKSSIEYRYQQINYDRGGDTKDKRSNFLLGGVDYAVNERIAVSTRLGGEYRERKSDRSQLSPYAELGIKRDYGRGSFVSLGYSYSIEETSDVRLYTDMLVNRFFFNWQHVLTPKLTATASLVWEPSILRGRRGLSPDRNETNTRVGTALLYTPAPNWSVAATLDLDRIHSQQPGRGLARERPGVSVKYAF